jgi:hypothetical protein
VEYQVAYEVRELALQMVRLDDAAWDAGLRGEWEEVGTLQQQRWGVQMQRSDLLRELWKWRRRAQR